MSALISFIIIIIFIYYVNGQAYGAGTILNSYWQYIYVSIIGNVVKSLLDIV